MERTGLVLVLVVGILSTSTYGYQLSGRKFVSKLTNKASNFVGKQKQNDIPLNIPDNAYPVENPRISFLCREDGLYSYPQDCTLGVRCWGGESQVFTCTDVLHFNNVTKECESFCSARCDPLLACPCRWDSCETSHNTLTVQESPVPLKSSKQLCTKDGTYLERNPLDCNTYFKCMDGDTDLLYCPDGQHFNPQTLRCEDASDVECESPMDLSNSIKQPIDFQCPENGVFANTVCETFIQCRGGQAYLINCPFGQHYEPYSQRCTTPCEARCDPNYERFCEEEEKIYEVTANTVEPPFICIEDGLYPDPMDCNQFIQCANNRAFLMKCPTGLHFSREKERCEWPEDAACDRITAMSPREDDETGDFDDGKSRISFTCPRDGFFASREHCNQYYECSHGRLVVRKCLSGLHFNKRTKSCDTPCRAKCDPRLPCPRQRSESLSTETPIVEHVTSSKLSFAFECSDDGLFSNPRDCRKYFNCSRGIAYDVSCPPSRHFNNKTNECETFCSAKCDPNLICNWQDSMLKFEEAYVDVCNHTGEAKYSTFIYDCEIYYLCEDREMNKFHCPDGQHFNVKTSRCEDPCQARCDPNLAETCGFEISTESQMKMSAREDSETVDFDEKLPRISVNCQHGDRYPDPQSCQIYYECWYERILIHVCLPGYHYNKKTKKCDAPCSAKCDPRLSEKCGWERTREPRIGITTETAVTEDRPLSSVSMESSKKVFKLKVKFVCFEDGLFPHRSDCNKYTNCSDGNAYELSCPPNRHFNNVTKRCETFCSAKCDPNLREQCGWGSIARSEFVSSDTLELDDNVMQHKLSKHLCSKTGTYLWKNVVDCNTYFKCVEGSAYMLYCPDDQHFNERTLRCEDPCDAHCDPFIDCKKEDKKRAPKLLLGDFDCQTDGYHVNPLDCGSFIQCFDGDAYAIYCPADLHYSPTMEICMSRCEAKCAPNYQEYCRAEEWNRRRKLQHPHSSPAKQPFPLVSEYICDNDGDYKTTESCNRYITCIMGESFERDCPIGLHFSELTRKCESPCEARCDLSLACECDWDTCDEKIQETSDEVDCEVEFDAGTCRGRFLRFAYDVWSGRCRGFIYGGCGGNSNNFKTMEECEDKCRKKLLRGYRCPADNGMFGHYPDCLSYYHCKRGIPTLKRCPKGKAFDHKKSKCVREHEAKCIYECKDRDAVYVFEEDCRKYIDCVNGIPKVERCPSGQAFDPDEMECVDEDEETCFAE